MLLPGHDADAIELIAGIGRHHADLLVLADGAVDDADEDDDAERKGPAKDARAAPAITPPAPLTDQERQWALDQPGIDRALRLCERIESGMP